MTKPSKLMIYALLDFWLIRTCVGATELPTLAKHLLATPWASLGLEAVPELASASNANVDLSAPVAASGELSSVRIAYLRETVESGQCVRCLRLEFLPSTTTGEHRMAALILDFTTRDRRVVNAQLRDLLRGAGVRSDVVDIAVRCDRESKWTQTWSIDQEMRSGEVRVTCHAKTWHIHFEHRRYSIQELTGTQQ